MVCQHLIEREYRRRARSQVTLESPQAAAGETLDDLRPKMLPNKKVE
jgi:hypothetical protein